MGIILLIVGIIVGIELMFVIVFICVIVGWYLLEVNLCFD